MARVARRITSLFLTINRNLAQPHVENQYVRKLISGLFGSLPDRTDMINISIWIIHESREIGEIKGHDPIF